MNLLLGHDTAVAEWVGTMNRKAFHPPFSAIGVLDSRGKIVGGFVFTGYNTDGVEMSLAGWGVQSRDAWRAVIAYVFGQLGCVRMQMHTRRSNRPVRKMAARLFHYEGTALRFYGEENGLCYSLTADDLPAFRAKWKLGD